MRTQKWIVILAGAIAVTLLATSAAVAGSHGEQGQQPNDHTHEHPSGRGRCVTPYENRPVTGRSCETDRGTFKVQLENGQEIETHGPDEIVVAGPGGTKGGGGGNGGGKPEPSPSPTPTPSPSPTAAPTPPICAEAGTDRSQLIYAVAKDDVDRYRESVDVALARFTFANDLLSTEAAELGKQISYRVACDAQGKPSVTRAVLDMTTAEQSFENIVNALIALGYDDPYTDYWVYYDHFFANGIGGQGSLCADDRLVAENCSNNAVPSYAIGYGYWDRTDIVMMHENGHNMGAVQLSSPNNTGRYHCNDGLDIMCYNDGGPTGTQQTLCYNTEQYDCGRNDYFNPEPPSDNYLFDHWNIASCLNRKLHNPACPEQPIPPPPPPPPPPGENQPPTADAGPDQVCRPQLLNRQCSTGWGSITDREGQLLAYEWVHMCGEQPCNSNVRRVYGVGGSSYTVPPETFTSGLLGRRTWVFELRVWDREGAMATDRTTVIVKEIYE